MRALTLAIDKIEIPDWVERGAARVEDDMLRKSIEQGGIQQPLVVVESDAGFLVAKGLRRLRVARALGMTKVPVVADLAPKGATPEEYVRRLRFILDHHRQDLLPTQKAELIETLKKQFSMTHRQVSAYLGIDEDSVTNWLAVRKYLPEIQQLVDGGRISMQAARVFDGLNEDGQKIILRRHEKELTAPGAGKLHKQIRALYPPDKNPGLYRDAGLIAQRLRRKQKPRTKSRPVLGPDEKRRLLNSYEMKEAELEELKVEQKQLKAEINSAIPVVAGIMRNPKLWALVPKDAKEEIERFAEVYV